MWSSILCDNRRQIWNPVTIHYISHTMTDKTGSGKEQFAFYCAFTVTYNTRSDVNLWNVSDPITTILLFFSDLMWVQHKFKQQRWIAIAQALHITVRNEARGDAMMQFFRLSWMTTYETLRKGRLWNISMTWSNVQNEWWFLMTNWTHVILNRNCIHHLQLLKWCQHGECTRYYLRDLIVIQPPDVWVHHECK